MHERLDAVNDGKIIQKAKINVQSSIMNLFFCSIFCMFISEEKLKIISFIQCWHKITFCNVGFSPVWKREV